LWKPIFALAKFFDSSTKFTCTLSSLSSPEESEDNGKACSLCSTILELAIDKAAQKNVENMTESGEVILIQVLGNIVAEDNYYKVKDIRDSMLKQFDEEQKWITTRWVGNALRRLGFSEKRRVGTGYEYRLTQAEVKDQCERLNVEYKADDFSRIKTLKYDDKGIEERECAFCGYKKPTGWIATTFKNETLPICDDCRKEWESRR
jgi:hypothetical protein